MSSKQHPRTVLALARIDSPRKVGRRIRETRDRAEFSQRQLAALAKITPAYVSRLEMGDRIPSWDVLEALAEPLGTNAQWLARGDAADVVLRLERQDVDRAIQAAGLEGLADLSDVDRQRLDVHLHREVVRATRDWALENVQVSS